MSCFKNIVTAIFFFFPITVWSQVLITNINLGTNANGTEFSFPFIKYSSAVSAGKINSYLQNDILSNDSIVTDSNKIFENSRFINSDSNWQAGYTSISYTVGLNSGTVFSLSFQLESSGAYSEYYSQQYNFSAQTGDLLTAEDIFTKEGIKEISTKLMKERSKRIRKWLMEMDTTYNVKEDSAYIRETFSECNNNAELNNFMIKPTIIMFYKEYCFPHAARPFDTDLDVEISYKDLTRFLTVKGNRLLFATK